MTLAVICAAHTAAADGRPRLVPATVLHVHDGDTITVRVGGRKERVRLIGMDTPEIERNEKFRRDARRDRRHTPGQLLALGRQARAFTLGLAPPGSEVGLEFDVSERDRYGRLLAYVWVKRGAGGSVMLNAELLKAGLARVMTIPPDVGRAKYFYGLQGQARSKGLGFWGR